MKRLVLAAAVLVALILSVGTVFAAGGTKVCIPEKEGKTIVTPKGGVCKVKYTLTELGAEGKEGPQGKEGEKGTGFAGAVNANGSISNGSGFTVSNPKTGEYELSLPSFGLCVASVEAPDTPVTPLYEGTAALADVVQQCKADTDIVIVRIFNTSGIPIENGFSFISQTG